MDSSPTTGCDNLGFVLPGLLCCRLEPKLPHFKSLSVSIFDALLLC